MPSRLDPKHVERLLEAGRGLLADLDLDLVLDRLLETARELTGAQYAAVGILDERRHELAQFIVRGVDEETHRAIGDLPRGRGILGLLIEDPRPLRLQDVSGHARSYGFPLAHPVMRTFLGVPVRIRGEAWGNLYLTEKAGGEPFTEADEIMVVTLADWAGIAIEHARLYEAVDQRRDELERAVRGFEATATIARAIGADTDLERVLELIVKRGRALVEARSVLILLLEGDHLVLASGAGHVLERAAEPLKASGSPFGEALRLRHAVRVDDVERRLGLRPEVLGVPDASAALLVPLDFRGRPLGLLVAFDRLSGDGAFTADDEQVLEAFAASAATAVANAQTVEAERLHHSLRAAEEERRRWARELHDDPLQALAGLKVLIAGALRRGDPEEMREALERAGEQVAEQIANLRSIITELRPAALDELGLEPALVSLLATMAARNGLEITHDIELPERRLGRDLETVVYRLVQESLHNVAKHAGASAVQVVVRAEGERLQVLVEDDGVGFDPGAATAGFGVAGMRERVALAGGELEIARGDGTTVCALLPIAYDEGSVTSPRSIA